MAIRALSGAQASAAAAVSIVATGGPPFRSQIAVVAAPLVATRLPSGEKRMSVTTWLSEPSSTNPSDRDAASMRATGLPTAATASSDPSGDHSTARTGWPASLNTLSSSRPSLT